jgi:hypothetical protein
MHGTHAPEIPEPFFMMGSECNNPKKKSGATASQHETKIRITTACPYLQVQHGQNIVYVKAIFIVLKNEADRFFGKLPLDSECDSIGALRRNIHQHGDVRSSAVEQETRILYGGGNLSHKTSTSKNCNSQHEWAIISSEKPCSSFLNQR